MLENSPNLPGGDITSRNDPRVLPIGRILRKTKINELPQLINIFCGELSIVGPRLSLTPNNFNMYTTEVQNIISNLRPGLSGIGSIVFRDEESIISNSVKVPLTHIALTLPLQRNFGVSFIQRKTAYSYIFLIIFVTLWVVIFPKSKIILKLLPDLPSPPEILRKHFKFK